MFMSSPGVGVMHKTNMQKPQEEDKTQDEDHREKDDKQTLSCFQFLFLNNCLYLWRGSAGKHMHFSPYVKQTGLCVQDKMS